ncbi:MAG: hypothetical protein IJL18_02540 [Synergistaceae bacterium]|nr:hypothetical protein [Synergistaceae bacterium]MBR0169199.1 hypothetical protein [Synergistaceae bacterium]
MIRAVIDVGSNSIKMRVADVSKGRVRVIRDETEVVKLGRGMSSTGLLSEERMKLSCSTVSRMARKARHLGAEIFIAGTMALRTAQNSSTFVGMVKSETGLDVHILSGNEEAKYSWLGASEGFRITGDAVMFDTGGGSTEFVAGSGREVKRSVSVPIGAVNLTERFFPDTNNPVKKSACDEAVKYLQCLFTENDIESFRPEKPDKSGCVIAVGGGVAAMSCVKCASEDFIPSKLHGTVLTLRDVTRQIRLYSSLTLSERENIIGLPKSRADVVLGSACIVFAALKILDAQSCTVSINGLRHGLLVGDI